MNIVILSSHTGWQTDELLRAMGERGHIGCVLPYEGLVARLGGNSSRALRTSIVFETLSVGTEKFGVS